MTVAADTRAAVRAHPFLYTALQAGVLNYTAAAEFLDVGEPDAVAAALRRYGDELDEYERESRRITVSMQSGVGPTDADAGIVAIGDEAFAPDGGSLTAIVATGDVNVSALETVLGRFRTADIRPVAAGGTDGHVALVVERRSGPDAVRTVEAALKGEQTTH